MRDYILHFEGAIRRAVESFASSLAPASRVLDAGAGQRQYAPYFRQHHYLGVDLGVGDAQWNYQLLDAIADLRALPFPTATFAGVLNVVTLEHVTDPQQVVAEMARVLAPHGRLLLIVPHEWEVHQHPHDYFRYTRFGCQLLLSRAGLAIESIEPVGGYFRLPTPRRRLAAPGRTPRAAPAPARPLRPPVRLHPRLHLPRPQTPRFTLS